MTTCGGYGIAQLLHRSIHPSSNWCLSYSQSIVLVFWVEFSQCLNYLDRKTGLLSDWKWKEWWRQQPQHAGTPTFRYPWKCILPGQLCCIQWQIYGDKYIVQISICLGKECFSSSQSKQEPPAVVKPMGNVKESSHQALNELMIPGEQVKRARAVGPVPTTKKSASYWTQYLWDYVLLESDIVPILHPDAGTVQYSVVLPMVCKPLYLQCLRVQYASYKMIW